MRTPVKTDVTGHDRDDWRRLDLLPLAGGLVGIALVVLACVRVFRVTDPTTVALALLLVVLVVASVGTLRVAIATSLVAVGAFNFFFLDPVGSWTIADPQNWVALAALLVVSIVASRLSAEARRRAREATDRRHELARLFDLTRDILLVPESDEALTFVARFIVRRFRLDRAVIALPQNGWTLHQSQEPGLMIDTRVLDEVMARARAGLEFDAQQRTYAGHIQATAGDGARVWVVPLRAGTEPVGLLALAGGDVEPGARDAIAGVTAVAIERSRLLGVRREADLVRRSADLRAALLASLSHDLRTPLTAATVAAGNLTASWLDEPERRDQARIVASELARLNRLFENIVEMARIETHAVSAELEWVQVSEIIEAASRQVEPVLAGHPITTQGVDDGMLVRVDPRLTSTALAHLIENAAQVLPGRIADPRRRLDVRRRAAAVGP